MKRFSEQLKKKAETIRLQAMERADLRERVISYMEYHPLPKEVSEAPVADAVSTEPYTAIRIDLMLLGRFLSAFAVLFLVIVPIVAERAVPGDVLYPIKVGFNEELRGTLTLSSYEKVEWETARLERRVAEARLLASEGKLTPEVEAEVAEAIKEHGEAAQKEIATIRETDNDQAVIAEIAFASALEVQSEVLESQLETGAETAPGTDGRSVAALASTVGEVHADALAQSSHEPVSYEKLLARIEAETTLAYEYLDSISDIASEEESEDIKRRLSDINTRIEAVIVGGDMEGVTALLTSILTDTRKLTSFMTNIDVRENVTVEELVPVVPTKSELTAIAKEDLDSLETLLVDINPRVEVLPDDLREKVELGLDQIKAGMASATSSLAAGEPQAAIDVLAEALILAGDLETMTVPYADVEVPVEITPDAATSTEEVIEDDNSTSTEDAVIKTDAETEETETTEEI